MKRGDWLYTIDILMVISFILAFFTGIIKFPALRRALRNSVLPFGTISLVHDISGVIMGLLIFVHIILHRKWLVLMTKQMFNKST